ncbi:peptide chain release factor N(5)-glutamine methyltransferase [Pseudogulbenkiania subflava]|uniref:Release factor glutamine methyltransferase n=1 Tax=Pseudogulbenkiania subflava DSM 22618 TaxID=1123014 RepID=A0A1Y6B9T3_9NEIS|nr:peptide chain release factor N(5)-glutamine methyltransferase [Pseudogulbenkiania subflava]SME98445.1 [protein release factor]-glutamine N5-methyltransferase [Pseudogulbenkiania subflava DSM 22618]
MTIDEALRRYPLPRLESRLLLMQVTGFAPAKLVGYPELELSPEQESAFVALAERRLSGEPIAYLLGEREFYGRPFLVSPAVLIPRPETEHLVEAALAKVGRSPAQVVDLGCGSGAIAATLALEAPEWQVSAVDVSDAALAIARQNAARLAAPVTFFLGSWYAPLPQGAIFDLIVSNPPYIAAADRHLGEGDVRFEPRLALTDENDGLSCLREIAAGAPERLVPGGWLMVEHGYDQGDAVRALFRAAGLAEVETLADLAGLDRVTLGRKAT